MKNQIAKLAEAINTIETEEEIMGLIKGASLVLNVDFYTLRKAVQNEYHDKYQRNETTTSEEAVYYSGNVN